MWRLRRDGHATLVVVYLPEYVVGHGGSTCCTPECVAAQARLLFQPGVMVTNVPWQLGSGRQPGAGLTGTGRRSTPLRPYNWACEHVAGGGAMAGSARLELPRRWRGRPGRVHPPRWCRRAAAR